MQVADVKGSEERRELELIWRGSPSGLLGTLPICALPGA